MRVHRDVLPSERIPDVLIYPGLTERSLTYGREGHLDAALGGFIDFVERHIGASLAGIGLGPERASMLLLDGDKPTVPSCAVVPRVVTHG